MGGTGTWEKIQVHGVKSAGKSPLGAPTARHDADKGRRTVEGGEAVLWNGLRHPGLNPVCPTRLLPRRGLALAVHTAAAASETPSTAATAGRAAATDNTVVPAGSMLVVRLDGTHRPPKVCSARSAHAEELVHVCLNATVESCFPIQV